MNRMYVNPEKKKILERTKAASRTPTYSRLQIPSQNDQECYCILHVYMRGEKGWVGGTPSKRERSINSYQDKTHLRSKLNCRQQHETTSNSVYDFRIQQTQDDIRNMNLAECC